VTGREQCDPATVRAAYREGPESYDRLWAPVIHPPAAAVVDALDLRAARRIVDVGAGTGTLMPALRAAGPAAMLLALDLSPPMLALAARREGCAPVLADAMRLPLAGGSVDVVLLAYMLFHLPDPAQGLAEAARVLEPGGRLGTTTWAQEWPSKAGAAWEQALTELGVAEFTPPSVHDGLSSISDLEALLDTAGFDVVRAWLAPVEATFDAEEFFTMRCGHGSSSVRLARLPDAERSRVLPKLRTMLDAFGPDDFTFRGEIVCTTSLRRRHPNQGRR
jgi:ubiquinone/menaquinone biosynthesis C-methylase UbiE